MSWETFFGAVGKVAEAFETGYKVGHELNDHGVQNAIDHYNPGSGAAGDSYLHFIDKHGDPAPAVEAVQHVLDALILHQDHSQAPHPISEDHSSSSAHSGSFDHCSGWDHSQS